MYKTFFFQIVKQFDYLNEQMSPTNVHWITSYHLNCRNTYQDLL